ncbi:hypothetical protein DUT90_00640 [Polaribacter sp. WD7]|uniref:hypothetical protein n=1 Tax=Polaribacter sp. WD7 TaxID=2269061 RepID=UPI000DF2C5C1|nr:hypothetical protein [Polaribacter sp. WD7]RCS28332.1 hypothetical protein DUT90_00640 [Polaribacter sp. WD7]
MTVKSYTFLLEFRDKKPILTLRKKSWIKSLYTKFKRFFVFFFCAISLLSCENSDIEINSDNLLLGVWVAPEYNQETTTFKRGKSLPKDGYAISFFESGNFIERTSGFCGTPPLIFYNEEGTFRLEKNIVSVSKTNQNINFAWKVISVSETELVVKRELTAQEIDHRILIDLFDEISALAYSQKCDDVSNWQLVAYGAKACGGPQGYLPYSNKIDTAAFLEKIEVYTETEIEYNVKWEIVSDCAVISPPKGMVCQNRFPIIKY